MSSFLGSFGIYLLIFSELLNLTSYFIFWIFVLISLALAVATVYFAMILPNYGFFGLGAFFGVIVAYILDELFFMDYYINDIIFEVISIILGTFYYLGIFFGALSYQYWRKMVIYMSTISGSFLIVYKYNL